MAIPSVTVIVVAYRSRPHVARLCAALRSQTEAHRLIVIDNSEMPQDRITLADLPDGAALYGFGNIGFAAANNKAVALADTDYVALLNPDAFPEPDWLHQLLQTACRWPSAAAIGSLQLCDEDPAIMDGLGDCYHPFGIAWRGGHLRALPSRLPAEGEVFAVCAAAALYNTHAWRAEGGFDESYFCYHEDVDLCFRLRLAGMHVVATPQAQVRHIGGASSAGESAFSAYYATRNGVWTFIKNMPQPLLWAVLPGAAAYWAFVFIASFLRPAGPARRKGLRDAFAALESPLKARPKIQHRRKCSLRSLARVLTWSPLAIKARRFKLVSRSAPPPAANIGHSRSS